MSEDVPIGRPEFPRATQVSERPDVPLFVVIAVIAVGAVALVALGVGWAVVRVASRVEPRIARARTDRAARGAEHVRTDEAAELLESVALRLTRSALEAGELPDALPEAPPLDPWGTPIRYVRESEDRGELRSAGKDRVVGTRDDVVREVSRR